MNRSATTYLPALALVLVACGTSCGGGDSNNSPPPAGPNTAFQGISVLVTGKLATSRAFHTATLLSNGRVLVTGGSGDSVTLRTAEMFDPTTQSFAPASPMAVERVLHTATLLNDGRVLMVGTNGENAAELFDLPAGIFVGTGMVNDARQGHTATLLPNGTVLIAGGEAPAVRATIPSCEIYNPGLGTFVFTSDLLSARQNHSATLLTNGKVLLTGGRTIVEGFGSGPALATSEIYDPSTGAFSATGSMSAARFNHTATLLQSGKVLVTGGLNSEVDLDSRIVSNAELFDPGTGVFTPLGNMLVPRALHTATALPDGRVYLAGGISGFHSHDGVVADFTLSTELFNPATNTFSNAPNLNTARCAHSATLLNNNQIVLIGGQGSNEGQVASAEIVK